jgi:predicted Zn-ribbon and HTH transcriptional regulator
VPYKNPEDRKTNHRKWKRANHEKYLAYMRIYNQKPELKIKKALRERIRRTRRRVELIIVLGGKCRQCGFHDYRALQLDHVNGCGTKERRSFPNQHTFVDYYWRNQELAKNVLQILCANCNFIKRYECHEVTSYDNYKEYLIMPLPLP